MKRILAVLFVTIMLTGVSFAADDIEKLRAEYQEIVATFQNNVETQSLLVEGFKSMNITYQAIVAQQLKLQEMAKVVAGKIQKLEAVVAPAEPVEDGGTAETD